MSEISYLNRNKGVLLKAEEAPCYSIKHQLFFPNLIPAFKGIDRYEMAAFWVNYKYGWSEPQTKDAGCNFIVLYF